MIEAAHYFGVDEIVILGDYADFYAVSRHQKHPMVDSLLLQEVDSVRQGLNEIDSLFPLAKKVFLEGNHEKRLESYLVAQAPALFGVTDVQYLFDLNRRPLWSFVPFGRDQKYKVLGLELYAFHRPKASAAKTNIQRVLSSSVYGDIHKIERAHAVGIDNRHHSAVCPGWLGDVNSRVFDYMPSTPQWQLGFAMVTHDHSYNEFFIDTFEIKNNRAIVYGKVFGGP
jgi:hypothetical protein